MNDEPSTAERKAREAAERVIAVCDTIAKLIAIGFDEFAADIRTQWAIEMGLIRIGEGVNRIPTAILERFDDQPWRQIVAMRNFAAHQYDDLDPQRVWRTVTRDVPTLRTYLAGTRHRAGPARRELRARTGDHARGTGVAGALLHRRAPVPPAPGRLTTTHCCRVSLDASSENARAMASTPPPAA